MCILAKNIYTSLKMCLYLLTKIFIYFLDSKYKHFCNILYAIIICNFHAISTYMKHVTKIFISTIYAKDKFLSSRINIYSLK